MTGRDTSTESAIQNIPLHTEVGKQIRDALARRAGHVFLPTDFSALEMRIISHMEKKNGKPY